MTFLHSRRWLITIAALLLVFFLFRPGAHPLRNRIANSIGSALGRRVELQNVRVHVLPRPGFDLSGLVIYDDPAFSAEPMVRADDVSANIRLRSLLRGRLEIASLSATEPSINLTRTPQGRWSLANLIERTAHIPVAPTGKPASGPRPAFPYLEATRARINFKFGQEKKSFALTDADLALWQDSENSWGVRLAAQPVRTDLNLTDTGRLRLDATWQRSERMAETPLEATLRWDQGQLGQVTKLLSGRDRGWRGDVRVSANFSGTPAAMMIRSRAEVDDFRRYDIMGGESVQLRTECSARYSTTNATMTDILCESPVGAGTVHIRGQIGPVQPFPPYDLTVEAKGVPLPSILRLARQAKKGLPADLVASGALNALFHAYKSGPEPTELSGSGSVSNARLATNGGKDEVVFGDVPFAIAGSKQAGPDRLRRQNKAAEPSGPYLQLGPFPLAMGGDAAAAAGGWIGTSGYHFTLRGDATLRNAFRLANTLGLPGQRPIAAGIAGVDLNVTGSWQGFAAPQVLGRAQLRNVRAEVRGFNVPIEIASALLTLSPDATTIEKISAKTGGTRWTGSASVPRACPAAGCRFEFNLAADELSPVDLETWFASHPPSRRWYGLLSSSEPMGQSPLLALAASGELRLNRLIWKKALGIQVQTHLSVGRGIVALTGLRAQLFRGLHQGNWKIDFSALPPLYRGSGTLENISLDSVGELLSEPWATGNVEGKFELTGSGATVADVLAHGEGSVQFVLRNGSIKHHDDAALPQPFPLHRLTGELLLKDGSWELRPAKVESHDGLYHIDGTASPEGVLSLRLTRSDEQSWDVTGTIASPRMTMVEGPEVRSELGSKVAGQR